MSKTLKQLSMAAVVLAVSLAGTHAQMFLPPGADNLVKKGGAEEVKFDPAKVHAPWQVAPPEQVVAGRDPASFRKDGTLLARTTREIPKVSESDLLERKYAMYRGRRFYRGPQGDPNAEPARQARVRRAVLADASTGTGGRLSGWIGWSMAAAIVAMLLVAWRKGWLVPFSARKVTVAHTSQAASGKPGSREEEKPLFELVRHDK